MYANGHDTREIVGIVSRLVSGDQSEEAETRFKELTGVSYWNARYASQFDEIVLFTIEDGNLGKVVRLGDEVGTHKEAFEAFWKRNPEASVEVWGKVFSWDRDRAGTVNCLHAHNRPDGIVVANLAWEAIESLGRYRLNDHQKAAARVYGDGDYAHVAKRSYANFGEFRKTLEGIDDAQFRYVMIELSDRAGVQDAEDAAQRMRDSASELEDVAAAIEQLAPAPAPR